MSNLQSLISVLTIPACHHFKTHGDTFIKHAKLTLIKQLRKTLNVSRDTLRPWLKRSEDFWILNSKHLLPRG